MNIEKQTIEQIKKDFDEGKEPLFIDNCADGHTIRDFENIPDGRCLVIALPTAQSAMIGVYAFGFHNDGTVTAKYMDGTRESAKFTKAEIRAFENSFQVIRMIQEKARNQ